MIPDTSCLPPGISPGTLNAMTSSTKGSKQPSKKASKAVTLRTIADHVKLSPATISIVLNGSPVAKSIPQETQDRVFSAAKELGYRPNFLARSLRNRRTYSVGVLVPEVIGGYAVGVMDGIERHLLEAEYFYLIASHRSKERLLQKYLQMLQDRSVEGFILIATQIGEPPALPTVAVAGHKELEGVTNIVIDHDLAIHGAMSHLVELGHRKIAFFKGHPNSSDTEDRWNAVRQSAAGLGIDMPTALCPQLSGESAGPVFTPQEAYEEGYAFGNRLLETGLEFTALMAFNDVSAIGAMRAFLDAGMDIPGDISVIGFDDIQSAAFHNPGLTTIRQPLSEMGEMAGRILLERLAGNDTYPPFVHVQPELILRGTTAPPPEHVHMRPPAAEPTFVAGPGRRRKLL